VVRFPQAQQTHRIRDLAVWQHKLRSVEFAVRSPSTTQPNPLVDHALMFASIWSPGAVCALERATGRLIWRRPLHPLGHDSVCLSEGVLYAHALHTLYALDAASGEILWSWRPARAGGAPLHASPCIADGRLFIGDEAGHFWCLDARTGHSLWSCEPSPDETTAVNATAAVFGRLVVTATTGGLAVAYAVDTGREVWRQQLDGPADSEIFRFKGRVALRTFWSVYLLGPKNGSIEQRWHWRERSIRHLVATRDSLLVVTQRAADMSTAPTAALLRASAAGDPGRMLIGLRPDGEAFRQPCPGYVVGMRWSSETGLVYESRLDGLGILDPRTGERLHDIVAPGERDHAHGGLVDVRDGTIYMLTRPGFLMALRHPERPRQGRPL
jgi:hypothetical protein